MVKENRAWRVEKVNDEATDDDPAGECGCAHRRGVRTGNPDCGADRYRNGNPDCGADRYRNGNPDRGADCYRNGNPDRGADRYRNGNPDRGADCYRNGNPDRHPCTAVSADSNS